MGALAQNFNLTEFLVWENAQETRHEFYRGQVRAMDGTRRVNALVIGSLATALHGHVKVRGCRAFILSMKVQPDEVTILYPDLFVTCDADDLKTDMIFRHPTLVAQVLAHSTLAYDRGSKFAAYRQIAALKEYLLIDPDTRRVEVFRRNERLNFELHDQTGHAELVLDSVNLRLPMTELFDGVESDGA